ncbi:MAG: hypothetical protein ACR2MZ_03670 [Candidatus Dormibacter sp.]
MDNPNPTRPRVVTMRVIRAGSSGMLLQQDSPDSGLFLSRRAKARLAFIDWHRRQGGNVSRTCRRFGISRPTFYCEY